MGTQTPPFLNIYNKVRDKKREHAIFLDILSYRLLICLAYLRRPSSLMMAR